MLELDRLQDATKLRALACRAFEVRASQGGGVIRSRFDVDVKSGLGWARANKSLCPLYAFGCGLCWSTRFGARTHTHLCCSRLFPA